MTLRSRRKAQRYLYPAILTYESDAVIVRFPDLEVEVSAKTEKDVYLTARVVLGRKLFELEEDGTDIPKGTSILEMELEENQATTLIDVYMPAVRSEEENRAVNRMITLPAWLNAAAMDREINFSRMLQEALRKEIFADYAE